MNQKTIKRIFSITLLLIFLSLFSLAFKGIIEMPRNLALFGLRFNLYGLILGIAFITVAELFQKKLTKSEAKLLKPIIPWLVISILVGARAWHVITDFELYKDNLIGIFYVWNGGLSIFGALLGLFVSFLIVVGLKGWKVGRPVLRSLGEGELEIIEKLALSIPVGQFIGRLGNFVNYELFGPPTNLPWGMFVPENYRPIEFVSSQFFHPAFLYEMIGTGLLFLLMHYLYKKKGIKGDGFFLYLYLTGYGFVRFFVDFFRTDPDVISFFSVGQLVCLIMIFFGVFRLWRISK